MTEGFSAAARMAGALLALGYLLAFVDGSLIAVIAALMLMTFGRALLLADGEDLQVGVAAAIVALGLAVVALRWGSLELGDVRGAQAVLGPTILVAPTLVATGSLLAGLGTVVATAVWIGRPYPASLSGPAWRLDLGVPVLAAVSVATGPAVPGFAPASIAWWAGGMLVAGIVVVLLALVIARVGRWGSVVALVLAALLVGTAAPLVVSAA